MTGGTAHRDALCQYSTLQGGVVIRMPATCAHTCTAAAGPASGEELHQRRAVRPLVRQPVYLKHTQETRVTTSSYPPANLFHLLTRSPKSRLARLPLTPLLWPARLTRYLGHKMIHPYNHANHHVGIGPPETHYSLVYPGLESRWCSKRQSYLPFLSCDSSRKRWLQRTHPYKPHRTLPYTKHEAFLAFPPGTKGPVFPASAWREGVHR